jgi:DNA-binding transcriptional LysR family regulator
VAKHKSFSLAAETLFVTQPSISIKIKQLENAYRIKLFERFGKRIELTNAGEVLFSYAAKIFNLVKEADSHMEDIRGAKFGTLRISAGLTLGTYYLPPLLAAFRGKYPEIEIHMKVKNKQEVIQDILSFKDDLGFIGHMESNEKLIQIPLWEEELVMIVSPYHDFTKMKTVRLSELNGQPFILRERGSGTRELVEEKLKKEHVSIKAVMELGSHEAIKRAVEVGFGMSIVPIGVIKREVKAGLLKVIRLPKEKIFLKYYLLYHRDKYLSHVMQAFINMALAHSNHSLEEKTRESHSFQGNGKRGATERYGIDSR